MRIYPLASYTRTYPDSTGVTYPTANYPYYILAGNSKRPILGETVYPFGEFELGYAASLVVSSLEYRLSGAGSWTDVSAGSYANVEEAIRFEGVEVSTLSSTRAYEVQVSFTTGSAVLTNRVEVPNTVDLPGMRRCNSGMTLRPFADARFAVDDTYVSKIEYSVSGVSAIAQTAITKPVIVSGTHNTGTSISLIDTTTDFSGLSVEVGDIVHMATGATMTISAINTTVSAGDTLSGTLSSGSFTSGAIYQVREELDLVGMARRWEYQFNTSGVYKMTLYVTDTESNEASDSVYIEVG